MLDLAHLPSTTQVSQLFLTRLSSSEYWIVEYRHSFQLGQSNNFTYSWKEETRSELLVTSLTTYFSSNKLPMRRLTEICTWTSNIVIEFQNLICLLDPLCFICFIEKSIRELNLFAVFSNCQKIYTRTLLLLKKLLFTVYKFCFRIFDRNLLYLYWYLVFFKQHTDIHKCK